MSVSFQLSTGNQGEDGLAIPFLDPHSAPFSLFVDFIFFRSVSEVQKIQSVSTASVEIPQIRFPALS